MSQKFWGGFAETIDTSHGANSMEWDDNLVNFPCTLLRSLLWVCWQGYELYDIGSAGLPIMPRGYSFADTNSVDNFTGGPTNAGGDPGRELIASDVIAPYFAGLGWPPGVTSDLSGSVNSIDSSATINETWNLNTFMYCSGRSFVDSHAQRVFEVKPHYKIVMWDLSAAALTVKGGSRMTVAWRGLYNQSP